MIKNNIKHFKKAFSLAEILLSVTIVAIILLLAMPAITKKSLDNIIKRGSDSAEFYFNEANNDNSILPCYITTMGGSENATTQVTDNTGECQVYDFTIPKGVHKIDLTLVAGGGGGGGAAGGRVITKTLTNADTNFTFSRTRLKKATINILTGAGTDGETSDPRKGGNSGTTVIDFALPNNFIAGNETLNMVSGDYSNVTPKEGVTATFKIQETGEGLVDTNITPISVDFKGIGVRFTSKMEDTTSDYTSIFFLSDAVTGASPWASSQVLCASNITDSSSPLIDQVSGPNLRTARVSGKQNLSSEDSIVTSLCKLNPASYKASVEGQTPVGLPSSTETITTGKISMGGKGGNNGSYWFEKGMGGDGAQLVYNCFKENGSSAATTCKWTSDYNSTAYASNTTGGARYGEMTFEIEHPGGVGTGGVGGSAVKINNLAVYPGKTYKILVGKGGAGGSKGSPGSTPSVGSNGTGGSTTAIFDESNNLIAMVIGGAGGNGGRINTSNSATNSTVPPTALATRNVPIVIIGSAYDGKITLDTDIASVAALIGNDNVDISTSGALAGAISQRLIYKFMSNMVQPMFALSVTSSTALTQSSYTFSNYNDASSGDRKMGGFSSYLTGTLTTNAYVARAFLNNTYSYKGESYYRIYTGFYFRYPILGTYYYPGGLGGFSGIGGKVGCGGGFVGNYNGYRLATSAVTGENVTMPEVKLENTIAMLKREGANDVAKVFDLSEYIDGCSTSTVNGHTAQFVAPVISNGKIENYGSAGTGGGGGGYNINLGSGNGASGQNGYVVVTWKK